MAFTVEDGTGLSTANAYLSVADYQAHHALRGVDVTDQTNAQIQAGIVNATDYIDKRFSTRFRGMKSKSTQALQWPRHSAYDDNDYPLSEVPAQLEKAIAEYAYIAISLGTNLAPLPTLAYPTRDPSSGTVSSVGSGPIKRKTEKVGPIEETTEFAVSVSMIQLPEYPQADLWLMELVRSRGEVYRG